MTAVKTQTNTRRRNIETVTIYRFFAFVFYSSQFIDAKEDDTATQNCRVSMTSSVTLTIFFLNSILTNSHHVLHRSIIDPEYNFRQRSQSERIDSKILNELE